MTPDEFFSSKEFYQGTIRVMERDAERMRRMGFVPEEEIKRAKEKIAELEKDGR